MWPSPITTASGATSALDEPAVDLPAPLAEDPCILPLVLLVLLDVELLDAPAPAVKLCSKLSPPGENLSAELDIGGVSFALVAAGTTGPAASESAFFLLLHGIFFIWCWTALGGSWLFDSENGKKQYRTIVEVQCFISKARQNINESNQRIVKS